MIKGIYVTQAEKDADPIATKDAVVVDNNTYAIIDLLSELNFRLGKTRW